VGQPRSRVRWALCCADVRWALCCADVRWALCCANVGWALCCAVALLGCGRSGETPSVLLVTLDTLRVDHVGAYGGPADAMPALDALAREGLVHERAYTTMPTTAPAHVSLFTGLLPHQHGVRSNGAAAPPGVRERDLSAHLRGAGYATAAFVTTSLLDRRLTGLDGFEIYDGPTRPLRPGAEAVEAALRWLDVESRRPVFLWVHLYDPHAPYGTADDKRRALPLSPADYGWLDATRFADAALRRERREAYLRGVRDADAALDALVAGVRARLEVAPLIVVTADHGEALDEHIDARGYGFDHGEFLDADQIRIPLVLAGPGVVAGRSPGVVSIRDLHATLLAVAGLSAGDPDARDLRATADASRVAICERRPGGARDEAPSPAAADLIRSHAVAASDGVTLLIAGENGAVSVQTGPADSALAEAARAVLAEGQHSGEVVAPPIDAATREALRSLGYAQ
jgi:arylsulfatase A-like enzyme